MTSCFRPLFSSLVETLFPRRCPGCGRPPATERDRLCAACLATVVPLRPPLCRLCGLELVGGLESRQLCGDCLRRPPDFVCARSLIRYQGVARRLIHRLKYDGDRVALPALREIAAGFDLGDFADCSAIVPVPLHRQRLRSRGLNQALELARLFFPAAAGVIRVDGLLRQKNTVPQTGLDGAARRRNLRGAFRTGPGLDFCGAVVCLVDDVYTTGTTASLCSQALLAGGAEAVKVLTLARVVAVGDGVGRG